MTALVESYSPNIKRIPSFLASIVDSMIVLLLITSLLRENFVKKIKKL